VGINPISRLIQIQQAKKEKEPIYSLVAEKGLPRRREFIMQVTVGEKQATGVGPNKKLAKRAAAEAMLQMLGYSRPSPLPAKPAIKTGNSSELNSNSSDKKVTFIDQENIAAAGRQSIRGRQPLLPGVLMMRDKVHGGLGAAPPGGYTGALGQGDLGMRGNPLGHDMNKYSPQTTAAIAKELLDTGCSPTAESILNTGAKAGTSPTAVRPKQQLLYLADVLGFQVEFTDFPKGNNKSEFLSLVSLSTNPPQVIHGAGPTLEASHDMAAHTALKALAETGLDNVQASPMEKKPILIKKNDDKITAGGDGPSVHGVHIKTEVNDIKHANSSDRGGVPTIKSEHQ
jgi:double-stranded RNA-binding protein Staufen